MTAADLIALIRKRHEGPAWIVVTEVANGTGGHAKRHADALALGLWPSHGHAIIGYETKVSREDVKKELRDPSKADPVGKFCDEWNLVISDESIIDGVIVPETWGILAPRKGVLRTVRKAPKREATPVTRSFMAALVRNVCRDWVPREKYEALRAEKTEPVDVDALGIKLKCEALEKSIADFEAKSGIQLHHYSAGRIGEAVRTLMSTKLDGSELRRAISQIGNTADHYGNLEAQARETVQRLTAVLEGKSE